MAAELFLNELSCGEPASCREQAISLMAQLIEVVRTAIKNGACNTLRTKSDFTLLPLCSGYRISQWRNDNSVDEVQRNYLRSLVTRSPLVEEGNERFDLEYKYQDKPAEGLGSAYYLGGLSISFSNIPCWNCSDISIQQVQINEEELIETQDVLVKHASSLSNLRVHQTWLKSKSLVPAFSIEMIISEIESCINEFVSKGVCISTDKVPYAFSRDFAVTARRCGFFSIDGNSVSALLIESCARIITKNPKSQLKDFNTKTIHDEWKSFRTHLTKKGPGYRLMLWKLSNESIVFANVGEKHELLISEEIESAPDFC